jgi:arylsulfatase A-like enzyme
MSRSTFASVLVGLLVVAAAASLERPELASAAPNVLVIVTDDQRAANTLFVMPSTRRFFESGGTQFTSAFSTTPLCCPSRSTILTGRYAHNTGVHNNGPSKEFDATTIFSRLLQEAGYQTAMVGKFLNSWPLTKPPPYFDAWAHGGTPYVDPTFNVDGTIRTDNGYSTNRVGTYAVRFLRGFERHDGSPWFLYVAPHAPHRPWTPAPRYEDVPVPKWNGNPSVFERDRSDKPPYVRSVFHTLAEGRVVREMQLRTLMSVDGMVGRIVRTLREQGENDTLAFFLSDNGYLWADHHLGHDGPSAGQKRVPYTESVKVPFLVRWPGHVARGARDARLTGTVDIAPTVLAAAGIAPDPTKPPFDGHSLLDPPLRDRILLEYWKETWIPTWASIRTATYQYIEDYGDDDTTVRFREYYDLVHDPWQLRNLLDDGNPNNDPAVGALSNQLADDRKCAGTRSGSTPCP